MGGALTECPKTGASVECQWRFCVSPCFTWPAHPCSHRHTNNKRLSFLCKNGTGSRRLGQEQLICIRSLWENEGETRSYDGFLLTRSHLTEQISWVKMCLISSVQAETNQTQHSDNTEPIFSYAEPRQDAICEDPRQEEGPDSLKKKKRDWVHGAKRTAQTQPQRRAITVLYVHFISLANQPRILRVFTVPSSPLLPSNMLWVSPAH